MTSNRRDFLRTLGSRVVREAREITEIAAPSIRAMSEFGNILGDNSAPDDSVYPGFEEPPPVRAEARTPARCLELEELGELARAEELQARVGPDPTAAGPVGANHTGCCRSRTG